MKKDKLINSVYQGMLMAAVMAVAVPFPDMAAWAQGNNIGSTVTSVNSSLVDVPKMVSILFYIGGAALAGAGLLKLKAHAENPSQTPISHGLGRLLVGAGLLVLPFVSGQIINTMNFGGSNTTFNAFGTIT
ncbi:MAG: hypothetical protein SFW62_09195 [Alphaproteobacteria bacterium]|nr:hypothetical protein [Alphaproteobacteria bacterium]